MLNERQGVLLYRPDSAATKAHSTKWIGPYTVLRTNGHVVQILDKNGKNDWVHRSQVQPIKERPTRLGPLPKFPNLAVPFKNILPVEVKGASRTSNECTKETVPEAVEETQPHQIQGKRPQRDRKPPSRLQYGQLGTPKT